MPTPRKLLVCLAVLLTSCRAMLPDPSDLHWVPVEVSSLGEASLRGLSSPVAGVIWISGSAGQVARSMDGGVTWRDASPKEATRDGLDLRSIHAVDAETAWVASAGEGTASRILKTTDGGMSWTTQMTNQEELGFYDSLRGWDAERAILMGDPVDGFITLLVTDDGGARWRRLGKERLPDPVEGEYGFAASNRTIALHGGATAWIGTGGAVARVWKTTDRGDSWSVAPSPLQQGDQAAGIFAIAFADADHGVTVGGNYTQPGNAEGSAAWSNDGGETWTLSTVPPGGYRSSVAPSPDNDLLWLAVGINGTDVSTDGGRTWHAIGSGGKEELNAVVITSDAAHAWAVGPKGSVRRMTLR